MDSTCYASERWDMDERKELIPKEYNRRRGGQRTRWKDKISEKDGSNWMRAIPRNRLSYLNQCFPTCGLKYV